MPDQPILYVKSGCPWCREAENFLHTHQVPYTLKDVLVDDEAFARMKRLTNQTLTPSLEYKNFIVADFSAAELEAALRKEPAVARELGISL